jgi:hypothetical protein
MARVEEHSLDRRGVARVAIAADSRAVGERLGGPWIRVASTTRDDVPS